MKLNLPNKLTLMRVCLIPLFMFFVIFPVLGDVASPIVAAVIFILTALTDMLDGKIARKYNLITDFGKFLDPLADKLLVFGGLMAILAAPGFRGTEAETAIFTKVFVWATFIIRHLHAPGRFVGRQHRHRRRLARQGQDRYPDGVHGHLAHRACGIGKSL